MRTADDFDAPQPEDVLRAFVGAISAWETTIEAALGSFDEPSDDLEMLDRDRFTPRDVTTSHALAARDLPHHRRDPFDRMPVAQARAEGPAWVTADARLAAYGVRSLAAST